MEQYRPGRLHDGDELTEARSAKTASSMRVSAIVITRYAHQRLRDRLGRVHPARGDRRSPGTGFSGAKLREVLNAATVARAVTIHGIHAFRRTFAVLLQEAGAPDSVIRQAPGHGQRGVTELNYLPRRDATVKRWVEAISVSVPALESPANQPSEDDSE